MGTPKHVSILQTLKDNAKKNKVSESLIQEIYDVLLENQHLTRRSSKVRKSIHELIQKHASSVPAKK